MFDDEQLGFLAGDEYQRAAALHATDQADESDQTDQVSTASQVSQAEQTGQVGQTDQADHVDRSETGSGRVLPADLLGRRVDDDPPVSPAPHPRGSAR